MEQNQQEEQKKESRRLRRNRNLEQRKVAARRVAPGSAAKKGEEAKDWTPKRDDITDKAGNMFAVLSCLSPNGNQRADHVYIKIRGAFPTLEEANDHAKILRMKDEDFDIWICEMYTWGRIPPTQKDEEEKPASYSQPQLNSIMENYYKQRTEQAKELKERQERAAKRAKEAAKERAKRLGIPYREPKFDQELVKEQGEAIQNSLEKAPDALKSVELLEQVVEAAEKQLREEATTGDEWIAEKQIRAPDETRPSEEEKKDA